MQGYQDKDYAMTIGFPGSTDRYLCSWGVQQRIENSNKPRIEVRGIKQGIFDTYGVASRHSLFPDALLDATHLDTGLITILDTLLHAPRTQICGKLQLLEELDRYE